MALTHSRTSLFPKSIRLLDAATYFPYNFGMECPLRVRLSYLFIVMTLVLGAAGIGAQEAGSWATKSPAPTKRTEVAVAAVGGKIYVIGGFVRGLSFITPLVEEYDPATDSWRERAPMPSGRHHAGIGVVNDRLYVIGGFEGALLNIWRPSASVYEYNPQTNQWSSRKPMPTPRGALAVAVLDGKLHAVGGYQQDRNTGAHEVYDPATDSWTAGAGLTVPRDHHAAAVVGGKLYAIGGRLNRQYSQNLSVNEMYDPATGQWSRRADLPTARSGIAASALGGRIYVFGGEAPSGTFHHNEAYKPDTDGWQEETPMPTARHGLGSAVVDGKIYVLSGGPTPGGSFSDVNEVFTPGATPGSRTGR
jgi:N-acetylneuraminic acid mutarotase